MKTRLLLYCTKGKPDLVDFREDYKQGLSMTEFWVFNTNERGSCGYTLNGKIVGECYYEVENIEFYTVNGDYVYINDSSDFLWEDSCVPLKELHKYFKGKNNGDTVGKAILIKDLHIFDEPKELSDYYIRQCEFGKCSTCKYGKDNIICSTIDTPITKAPQNMMYAYDSEYNKYIVISIQPQWMCKILNREKTVEVRKKVLKEMLK